MRDFMHDNESSFKDIESFMHILHDWVDETIHNIISKGLDKKKLDAQPEGAASKQAESTSKPTEAAPASAAADS